MRLGINVAFLSLHRTEILEVIMAAIHSREDFAAFVHKVAAHDQNANEVRPLFAADILNALLTE